MIVLDASTMILLGKIDMLELFVSNFQGKILLPERIRSEIFAGRGEEIPVIAKLIEDKKVVVLKVKNSREINKLIEDFNIGAGEAGVLTLAVQEGANIIATDDRNAIRACKILKIDFVTAVAILIRTFEKGLIDKEEALIKLEKLRSVGRYSKAVIEDATRHIKGGV